MSEPFLGQIAMFAGTFVPRGWLACEGQLLPINDHQSLYSLLGTFYGGDGLQSFALPDLRGRVPIHAGSGPGLTTRRQGDRGGAETVTLSAAELPAHQHTITGTLGWGSGTEAATWPGDTVAHTGATASAGGGQAHDNLPPFTCVQFIIATQGIYPSRN